MLYHLLYPLREYFFGFNVFRYITFRSAYATVTALLICFIFGPRMIRWLRNLQVSHIREDVPERHNGKVGTPSMGGMLMILAIVIPTLLWADLENLYIADTGIFPQCPSVNPMLTGMALARRQARVLSERL